MTANDRSRGLAKDAGVDGPQRPTVFRGDRGLALRLTPGAEHNHEPTIWHRFPRLLPALGAILLILMIIFSAIPMIIDLRGHCEQGLQPLVSGWSCDSPGD